MSNVYVVGVGMTRFGRMPDRTVKSLTCESVELALADAGISADLIGAAFFSNATQSPLEGQFMVPGQIALREMGFETVPIYNVENACASATTAFNLAYTHIRAGISDFALAVGTEKMCIPDKAKSFGVFDGAWDVTRAQETADGLAQLGRGVSPPPGRETPPTQRSLFMDIYANLARHHMETYGTTERQLAHIASKNHHHASMNPLAQYRQEMSVEEVLAARMISWPLTIAMCAPISDGSAAAILCSEEGLKRLGGDPRRAVAIRASVLSGGTNRDATDLPRQISRLAANKAYEAAGLGPQDMSLAEVHDAATFGEIQHSEHLGFCEYGLGGWIAERGETSLGGRIPINPSGGLECKGHPIGATGLGQIHELVTQLRHEAGPRQVENARFAIAENGGGFYRNEEAVTCVTILGRAGA